MRYKKSRVAGVLLDMFQSIFVALIGVLVMGIVVYLFVL